MFWGPGNFVRLYCRLEFERNEQAIDRLMTGTRSFIVIFNHTSHLDVMVAALCLRIGIIPKMNFLAKKELFEDWRTGWMMRRGGGIPVDRDIADTSAVRGILKVLNAGRGIFLSPEGTRSYTGEIQPFKDSFARLAVKTNALVVPIGIIGAYKAWPRNTTFPRPRKVKIRFTELIDPQDYLGKKPTDEEYSQFVDMTRNRIIDLITEKR